MIWFTLLAKNDALTNCAPALPDCDSEDPPFTIELEFAPCRYVENLWSNKFTGSEEWLVVNKPCHNQSIFCLKVWQLCKNYNTGKVEIISYNCTPVAFPNCSSTEPQIPPIGKGWEEAWTTECFAKDCCQ